MTLGAPGPPSLWSPRDGNGARTICVLQVVTIDAGSGFGFGMDQWKSACFGAELSFMMIFRDLNFLTRRWQGSGNAA